MGVRQFRKAPGVTVDLTQVAAIGGPTSVITAVFVVLINAWLSTRKDKREQQEADVQTLGAHIGNAGQIIHLIHQESDRVKGDIAELIERAEKAEEANRQLERHINTQDDTIARQQRQIEWLTEDLTKARTEIAEMRRQL